MSLNSYQYYKLSLSANGSLRLPTRGDFVRVLSNTGSEHIKISYDQGTGESFPAGIAHQAPQVFEVLNISNPSAGAAIIELTVSIGKVDDSRLTLSSSELSVDSSGNNLIINGGKVGSVSHANIAANGSRRAIVIQNKSNSNKMYVVNAATSGTTPETATSIEIDPRGTAEIETKAAVYFYEDTSGASDCDYAFWEVT